MCAALRPPTNTRQVQSDSANAGVSLTATTLRNSGSSATSTVNRSAGNPASGALRVQRSTLTAFGSPDATPSGYTSRRSVHFCRAWAGLPAQATDAPMETAASMNARRLSIQPFCASRAPAINQRCDAYESTDAQALDSQSASTVDCSLGRACGCEDG